jgi:hypothetical protein
MYKDNKSIKRWWFLNSKQTQNWFRNIEGIQLRPTPKNDKKTFAN